MGPLGRIASWPLKWAVKCQLPCQKSYRISVIIFDFDQILIVISYNINTEETITGGTFQLLVLYLNTQTEDIKMIITNNILKNKIENHNNISNIKESIKLNSVIICHVCNLLMCFVLLNYMSLGLILLISLYYHSNIMDPM